MKADMAISLLDTIRSGDEQLAKRIVLQINSKHIDRQTARQDGTPLFWACCQGFIDLVQLLILHGADVNRCTSWGATPLHASVDHDQADIVSTLIRFGANVDQQTRNGDTPLHLAAYRGHQKCVQCLVQNGASVNKKNKKQRSPIQEAYNSGHLKVYGYLKAVQNLIGVNSTSLSSDTSSIGFISGFSDTIPLDKSNSIPNCFQSSVRQTNNTPYVSEASLTQGDSFIVAYPPSEYKAPNFTRVIRKRIDKSDQWPNDEILNSHLFYGGGESVRSDCYNSGTHSSNLFPTDFISGESERKIENSPEVSGVNRIHPNLEGMDTERTVNPLLGVLRITNTDFLSSDSESSSLNDLSSVESSCQTSSSMKKPVLSFKNI